MNDAETIEALKRRLAAAEAALRESEARHRVLIGSFAQAVWETDAAGVVVKDSPSWRAYTGQTMEEWLGYGWLDAIHPDDRAYAERQWREAMAVRGLVNAEFRLAAPDGGWRWSNVRAVAVLDEMGNIEKWAGMNIDIDDRKHAETTLRESEGRLRTLFDSIDEGYAEFDVILGQDGQVIDWRYVALNAAFTRLTGMEAVDVIGRLISEIVPTLEPEWGQLYTRILKTGEPIRFEQQAASLGQWYEVYASRSGGPDSLRIVVVYNDISARKRAELALRESEERQSFLLKLSDRFRSLSDPDAIRSAAVRIMAEELDVNRAAYVDLLAPERDTSMRIAHIYEKDVTPWIGDMSVADYGASLGAAFTAGQTAVVTDIETEPRFADAIDTYRKFEIRSAVAVPIVKEGKLVGAMGVHYTKPRNWTAKEIKLLEDIADRTWDAVNRAQAEAALRVSEERFAQFAKASSDALWIRNADTLAMEYVSPAMRAIYGIESDAFLGDVKKWAAHVVPDDRDLALAHLARAKGGESVVHEFRIQRPADGSFRWIRDTDFPLLDAHGHIQRIGGIAQDVSEAKLAAEHQGVLLAELQHRVRNIMAMIRSVVARTGERAESVADYAEVMMGRLLALARVQALLTRGANVEVSIAAMVRDEVSAQAQHQGQYQLEGPDIALAPKAAEVLTLAVHELATNALKYGALSVPDGKVTVRWSVFEKRDLSWLSFDWSEQGAPRRATTPSDEPRRRGFGSELVEGRIPYELKGTGKVSIGLDGARCHLEFPLRAGASILETGAPQRAIVFGGALDMTGEADLRGHRILVVEDDYYLATDAARALAGAGADVMGPCATEEDARLEIEEHRPAAVVLDVNLGRGPSFKLAETLKDLGIPFVFITGYDQEVIPVEFEGIERLQKPVQLRQIVGGVARLIEANS